MNTRASPANITAPAPAMSAVAVLVALVFRLSLLKIGSEP